MLAQNFKTANDLNISDQMLADLIRTLGRMERGEIPDDRFCMNVVGAPDCGTAGCILGWARGRFRNPNWPSSPELFDRGDELSRLFFPNFKDRKAWKASVEQAAIALRSYLTTGEANWAEALAAS